MAHLPRFLIILLILTWNGIGINFARATPVPIIVFDNTINPSGTIFGPGCCQVGNEVTLGGTEREIVQVSWLVDSQNNDIVGRIETQIYANDGPGGTPGTLLWDSGPLTGINVSATDTLLDISVPNIIVPDIITVTSRILDAVPVALGRLGGGIPVVGSVNTSWIESSPGTWNQQFGPWGLRVMAVPEPPVVLLLISTSVLLIGLLRKKAAHTDEQPQYNQTYI